MSCDGGFGVVGVSASQDVDVALAAFAPPLKSELEKKVGDLCKQAKGAFKAQKHTFERYRALKKFLIKFQEDGVLDSRFKTPQELEQMTKQAKREALSSQGDFTKAKAAHQAAEASLRFARSPEVLQEFDLRTPVTPPSNGTAVRALREPAGPPQPAICERVSPSRSPAYLGEGASGAVFRYETEDGTWEAHKWMEDVSPTEVWVVETGAKGVLPGRYYDPEDSPPTVLGRLTPSPPRETHVLATPLCPYKLKLVPEHAYRTIIRVLTPLVGIEDETGAQIAHMDIKPTNIVVNEHGEIFLIDWGLAKTPEEFEAMLQDYRAGRIGMIPGNYQTLPPEAIVSDQEMEFNSYDAWGVGLLAYRMLTGQAFPGLTRELGGRGIGQVMQTILPLGKDVKNGAVKELRQMRSLRKQIRDQRVAAADQTRSERRRTQAATILAMNEASLAKLEREFPEKFPKANLFILNVRAARADVLEPLQAKVEELRSAGGAELAQAEKELREMKALCDVMIQSLDLDPKMRPSARGALSHLPHTEAELLIPRDRLEESVTASPLAAAASGEGGSGSHPSMPEL
ncbi:MAG: Serine/threonine-protein kinase PknD [Chlamydiia bacterium]|nr:Serine/threonine-protein kinase PknD [Chlamydiia bacterium]MCH9615302.1 Serine/threonine-protein kinase PknD [Chlamydiia bacterium]MCH9628376.1 Serine/threonine-protein kinase PknD [Chlamydiia bacterium]